MDKSGLLDGRTILRFAHAFKTGGGMERIMDDLDGIILARNAMTVIRMHIASDRTMLEPQVEYLGRGRLICIPLPLPENENMQLAPDHESTGEKMSQVFRDSVIYNPVLWHLFFKRLLLRRKLPRARGQVEGAGRCFSELCTQHNIDLCMMHFFGGSDADEIIHAALSRKIPVALENHFSNERFIHLSIRKHVMQATAVAGMNGLDVPNYLRPKFVNLADGIDMDVFDRRQATPPQNTPSKPFVFLPSRIVRPKGHMDVVKAVARLREEGLDIAIAFAGRIESSSFIDELKSEIARCHLTDDTYFLGELSPTALRNWYAASSVLVFPTYHHEGLGRIIIEAQAMEVPVVAYATGGVPEGVINGVTGYLVPTGDSKSLTAQLGLLLGDPDLRVKMGKQGRAFVSDRYSLPALAARHEQFYIQAMGR